MRSVIMNGYLQAKEIAKRWNISIRQVQILCKTGKIDGAVKFGMTWAIPEKIVKPTRTTLVQTRKEAKTSGVK